MNFADQLVKEISRKNTRVCVGLDSDFSKLPKEYAGWADKAEAVFDFNKNIIEAVKDDCAIVKPNLAFYLALGDDGWKALKKTVDCAKSEGLLTILDCKANDIGNTAEAYAKAFFEDLEADAITANPLLGSDALTPFFKQCSRGKGIFVLVKTSNPSSKEFQDLKTSERSTVSGEIAKKIVEWEEQGLGEKGYSSIGAVVGATFPEEARKLRREMKKQFFLVPGYGTQGADSESIKNFFNENGLGAVVNSSRGIIFASGGKDFAEKAGEATRKMKGEINKALGV
ncbi:MAG: orotidine-5'-phosphate decarboxylase [Candidatus Micrarchaeota archaeon]